VRHEPDSINELSGDTLVANLSDRGVWLPQAEALFNVHLVNKILMPMTHTPKSVLFRAEIEKQHKYSAACCAYRVHLTVDSNSAFFI